MIIYLCTQHNRMPIHRYLAAEFGTDLHRRFLPAEYESAVHWKDLPEGAYIFSDTDQLTGPLLDAACALLGRVIGARHTALNHPRESMRRMELHAALQREGTNRFGSHAVRGLDPHGVRYPAFLRRDDDHFGSRSALLRSPAELEAAIRALTGHGTDAAWIVTEFDDGSDAEGIFRKYSAFYVAGKVIPRHVFFSRDWMQKNPDLTSPEFMEEEQAYVDGNPHEEKISGVFRRARIGYGRIDYGMRPDGSMQVWEINTNPSILRIGYASLGVRGARHRLFAGRLREAFEALDDASGGMDVPAEFTRLQTTNMVRQAEWYYRDIIFPKAAPWLRSLSRAKRKLTGHAQPEETATGSQNVSGT